MCNSRRTVITINTFYFKAKKKYSLHSESIQLNITNNIRNNKTNHTF